MRSRRRRCPQRARSGLTSAQAQTLLDVTQAYYDASLGDRLVGIAEATLEQADTTLSQTHLARQVGNQSEFDLLRARVTRDNQRPVVIQRRADRDLAYFRLKQLLDFPLDQPLALTTELGDTTLADAPAALAAGATPGDTRTDTPGAGAAGGRGGDAQQGLLRVAQAQRLPQVAAELRFRPAGLSQTTSRPSARTTSPTGWCRWARVPLFTGGRIRGEVESARANLEQARLRLEQTRELAEVDARKALLQLEAAEAAWQASAGTEEQAARAYQIAELRYREGISTQTELNDLRIQLAQAQVNASPRRPRPAGRASCASLLLPALPLLGATASATAARDLRRPARWQHQRGRSDRRYSGARHRRRPAPATGAPSEETQDRGQRWSMSTRAAVRSLLAAVVLRRPATRDERGGRGKAPRRPWSARRTSRWRSAQSRRRTVPSRARWSRSSRPRSAPRSGGPVDRRPTRTTGSG